MVPPVVDTVLHFFFSLVRRWKSVEKKCQLPKHLVRDTGSVAFFPALSSQQRSGVGSSCGEHNLSALKCKETSDPECRLDS